MSADTSTGERWAHTVAAVLPGLPFPLRSDPKPRPTWPQGLTHLDGQQWPLGLRLALEQTPRDGLAWSIDRYVDERGARQ